jgi:nucleoside-diphosphate-sugar epimerase
MYRLIRQIEKRLFVPIGNGGNIKSVAYVENLVDATLFLINNGYKGIEVYNYADEPNMSFKEIIDLIYKYLGRSSPKVYLPLSPILISLKPIDTMFKIFNKDFVVTSAIAKMNKSTHHKAQKIVKAGFKPAHSLEQGLHNMVNWYTNDRKKIDLQNEIHE